MYALTGRFGLLIWPLLDPICRVLHAELAYRGDGVVERLVAEHGMRDLVVVLEGAGLVKRERVEQHHAVGLDVRDRRFADVDVVAACTVDRVPGDEVGLARGGERAVVHRGRRLCRYRDVRAGAADVHVVEPDRAAAVRVVPERADLVDRVPLELAPERVVHAAAKAGADAEAAGAPGAGVAPLGREGVELAVVTRSFERGVRGRREGDGEVVPLAVGVLGRDGPEQAEFVVGRAVVRVAAVGLVREHDAHVERRIGVGRVREQAHVERVALAVARADALRRRRRLRSAATQNPRACKGPR